MKKEEPPSEDDGRWGFPHGVNDLWILLAVIAALIGIAFVIGGK